MNLSIINLRVLFAIIVLSGLFWQPNATIAGDIAIGLSDDQAYVGVPIILQIRFSNVSEHEPPEIPEVDGLEIESGGSPAVSKKVSISFNGRKSINESVTYSYSITPIREGDFVIPPLTVSHDGRKELTTSVRFTATKSENTDLVFVEIAGDASRAYVGQQIALTLKIYIKPFNSKQHGITLSEANMWSMVSKRTDWGVFSERLQEIADNNQRPGGDEVIRKDSNGNDQTYYCYEIDASIYAQRSGAVGADDCRIVVDYPTKIGRTKSPFQSLFEDDGFPFPRSSFFDDAFSSSFGSRLAITDTRPVVAEVASSNITISPIPMKGRPASFTGAVGNYSIYAEAKPTRVSTGDPITLHLVVTGDGQMDRVQPPPLSSMSEIRANFRVPNDDLAGLIENNRKLFTTTLRPKTSDVKQIPAIPFSFFDPKKEQFVTTQTEPIKIAVEQSETLSLDRIVSNQPKNKLTSESNESKVENEDQSYTLGLPLHPTNELLGSQSRSQLIPMWVLAVSLFFPTLFVITLLLPLRKHVARIAGGRILWSRSLHRQIDQANNAGQLRQFILNGLAAHLGMDEADETILLGRMRTLRHQSEAVQLESLFSRIRKLETGVSIGQHESIADLQQAAHEFINKFTQSKKGQKRQVSANSILVTRALFIIAVSSALFATPTHASMPNVINDNQRKVMLREARDAFAAEQFGVAAAKFETVIESGIENAKILYNAGLANLRAENRGLATYYFRRAMILDPNDSAILEAWKQSVDTNESFSDLTQIRVTNLGGNWRVKTQTLTSLLLTYVRRDWLLWTAATLWGLGWSLLILRQMGLSIVGRFWPSASVIAALLLGLILWAHANAFDSAGYGIVVVSEATIRQTDDELSEPLAGSLTGGHEIRILGQRGDWFRVEVAGSNKNSGWIRQGMIRPL